jgi:polyferredoxin
MVKLHREPGLIRYDSQRSFDGEKKRFLRPRVFVYAAFALAGMVAFSVTALARRPFAATIVRQAGMPYVIDGEVVRNAFVLVAHNPGNDPNTLTMTLDLPPSVKANVSTKVFALAAGDDVREPLFLEAPRSHGPFDFVIHVRDDAGRETELKARFIAPSP